VVHSAAHKAYAEWKHQELALLKPSPLYYYAKAKYPFWRFVTRSHPYLIELREVFYREGKKVVPDQIFDLIRTPQSLAVWFMDDGTLNKESSSVLLETQAFSLDEIERLRQCLWMNFRIQSHPVHSGRGRGLRLYVPVAEARKLSQIIEPHVIASMRYKLPMSP